MYCMYISKESLWKTYHDEAAQISVPIFYNCNADIVGDDELTHVEESVRAGVKITVEVMRCALCVYLGSLPLF